MTRARQGGADLTTRKRPNDADLTMKLSAFAWAAGNTGLVLILVALLAWLLYILRASGALGGLPLWLIPRSESLFLWVMLLKMLAVLSLSAWLLARLWARRLNA
ncbi:MAG: hypothetical protein GF330_02120 [Candidatus Eisenbacteria bacterium]|nr:hypothetical protein [Candidatus Eisenbacteria bacterium]